MQRHIEERWHVRAERDKNYAEFLAASIANRILNGLGRMFGGR